MVTTPTPPPPPPSRVGACWRCKERNKVLIWVGVPPEWEVTVQDVTYTAMWICYGCDVDRLVVIATGSGEV